MTSEIRVAIALLLLIVGPALQASPGGDPDALLGCYASGPDTPATTRLVKEEGRYFLDGTSPGTKRFELFFKPLPDAGKAAGTPMADVETILLAEIPVIGLFKFREGAVVDGKVVESEYYFYAPQVGGFLFKRDCPAP